MTALLFAGLTRDGKGTLSRCRGASPRTPPEFAGESYVHQAHVWHVSGDAVLARPQRDAARQAMQVAQWGAAPAIVDVDVEVMTTIRAAIARILSTASMVYSNRATAKLADWLGKRC